MAAPRADELLPALNADVLFIILEYLLSLNGRKSTRENSFLSLRTVSKQMNELVLRIGFRRVLLDPEKFDTFRIYLEVQRQMPVHDTWPHQTPQNIDDRVRVGRHMGTYTQHLQIGERCQDINWSWLPDMLYNLENLKEINWSCWGPTNNVANAINTDVLGRSLLRAQLPRLRVSISGFYRDEAWRYHPELVDLVSCTSCALPFDLSPTHLIELKKMLLASPNMETFDMKYINREDVGTDWDIRDGEKLPPFKKLTLWDICWCFSPVEAVTFWDWSRITHLRMVGVHIINFLRTVPPKYLSGLRTFETNCWGAEEGVEEANDLLCNLVNNIATLERLEMRVIMRSHLKRCLAAIGNHGRSLRYLSLRDFKWPLQDPRLPSVFPIEYFKDLCSACPHLCRLEIGITLNVGVKGRSILLNALASLRNLRELVLETKLSFPSPPSLDTDDIFTMRGKVESTVAPWIKQLVSAKKGLPFDRLILHVGATQASVPDDDDLPCTIGSDHTITQDDRDGFLATRNELAELNVDVGVRYCFVGNFVQSTHESGVDI